MRLSESSIIEQRLSKNQKQVNPRQLRTRRITDCSSSGHAQPRSQRRAPQGQASRPFPRKAGNAQRTCMLATLPFSPKGAFVWRQTYSSSQVTLLPSPGESFEFKGTRTWTVQPRIVSSAIHTTVCVVPAFDKTRWDLSLLKVLPIGTKINLFLMQNTFSLDFHCWTFSGVESSPNQMSYSIY